MTMLRRFLPFLGALLFAYCGVLCVLFFYQRHLIYHPETIAVSPTPPFADIPLRTADGTAITGWHAPPADSAPTVLFLHGNAGHLGQRHRKHALYLGAGYGVFALSYRGFGPSAGSPTEQGLYHDARAAIAYLEAQGVPPGQLILHGESLGAAVAIQMATEITPRALVLEVPFATLEAASRVHYPWVPVSLLLQDRYESLTKIPRIAAPMLILHGEKDTLVPQEQSLLLRQAAHAPVTRITFPQEGHNVPVSLTQEPILRFLGSLPPP